MAQLELAFATVFDALMHKQNELYSLQVLLKSRKLSEVKVPSLSLCSRFASKRSSSISGCGNATSD